MDSAAAIELYQAETQEKPAESWLLLYYFDQCDPRGKRLAMAQIKALAHLGAPVVPK